MNKLIRQAVGAIITKDDKFLLIRKEKMNTNSGKIRIKGEWDFVKGGVERDDANSEVAIFRELKEETGSSQYTIIRKYEDKICFDFPPLLQEQIGYTAQETTMYHMEFTGKVDEISPFDDEIYKSLFVNKTTVLNLLKHEDTKQFFLKYF